MLKQQIAYFSLKKTKNNNNKEAKRCYTHLLLYLKVIWGQQSLENIFSKDFLCVSPSRRINFTYANVYLIGCTRFFFLKKVKIKF
jgi:hypothetical protein